MRHQHATGRHRLHSLLALAFTLAAATADGLAAEAAPADRVLEDITVTARRQEVELQDAPVAVSVVDAEAFDDAQLRTLDNLDGWVPGLLVTRNDGAGRVAAIRGVGWETAQNLSTQPSVLVYVDGVYLANPLALGLHLGEIERIEVFRGPQGTEFGQGTTGGAINIVTRAPDFSAVGGDVQVAGGSYDLFEAAAQVNVPLTERLAVRASLQRYDRAGFSRIEGGALDGYELDAADVASGRLALSWLPTDRLALRLSGWLHRSDQSGAAQKHVDDPNPDPRRLTQDFPSTFGLDNASWSLVIDWQGPAGLTLRSLSGYQRLDKRQTVDGDRLIEELVATDLTGFGPAAFDILPFWNNTSRAWSQEISLRRQGERLDWVGGLYYLDHANDHFFLEAIGPGPIEQFAAALADPSPETLPPFTPPLEFVEDRTVTRHDSALFGQATYRATERWAWTLGARYQRDRSTDRATQFWILESRQITEDDALTWKLGADWTLDDDHTLYALLATGWKNGGNNPGALTGGAFDVPADFAPEEVTTFEIGSRNRLVGGRGRLDATAFVSRYENYQFLQEDPVPFSGGTGNIPEVEIFGLESEFAWLLPHGFRLDGQATALGGSIRSELRTLDVADVLASGAGRFTPTGIADRAALRVDLAGNRPPKLPDLTARLALGHRATLAGGRLDSRLFWIYRGAYQYRVFNNPATDRVPAYETWGLALTWAPARRPVEFSLRASNLFDEAGVNSRFTNPFGLHTTSEELIPPRQVSLSARYRF